MTRGTEKTHERWKEAERRASLVAQLVKNLLAMQETQVQSLGQEDPLGNGMAYNSYKEFKGFTYLVKRARLTQFK